MTLIDSWFYGNYNTIKCNSCGEKSRLIQQFLPGGKHLVGDASRKVIFRKLMIGYDMINGWPRADDMCLKSALFKTYKLEPSAKNTS